MEMDSEALMDLASWMSWMSLTRSGINRGCSLVCSLVCLLSPENRSSEVE
jgi:hypothetical protein